MALDRRIAVNRIDFVRDEHGNSTSSIGETWDVWATRMDRSLEDVAGYGRAVETLSTEAGVYAGLQSWPASDQLSCKS